MTKLLKSRLLLLAAVLAGSVVSPPAEAARTCPVGTFSTILVVYYTDASYTSAVCSDGGCNGDFCDTPTPYYRVFTVCCPAS